MEQNRVLVIRIILNSPKDGSRSWRNVIASVSNLGLRSALDSVIHEATFRNIRLFIPGFTLNISDIYDTMAA